MTIFARQSTGAPARFACPFLEPPSERFRASPAKSVRSRKWIVDSFVCNPATAVKLATLKEFGATGSNKALLQADPTAPTSRVLGGVPLLTSPSIGDDVVWAVPRNRAVIALRSGTEVTTDNSVYFTSRRVGVRAVLRIGWAFTDVAAVSKIAITP
jgi:HK97 family phage major capsid protein